MKKFRNENGYMERDLRGMRFGLLVVIGVVAVSGRREAGKPEALCQCGCGNLHQVRSDSLISGNTKSCGCQARGDMQAMAERAKEANRTHGLRGHKLYDTWAQMNRRCYNPASADYKHYGALGVEVYPEWRKEHGPGAFIQFCDDVLGPRPDGYSLDRICPEGDYWPGNIRWASAETQANNKRGKAA